MSELYSMQAAPQEPDLAGVVRNFFFSVLGMLFIAEALCAVATPSLETGLLFFGLNFTLSAAAGLAGGLLGFVFGIPRALTSDQPAAGAGEGADQSRSRPNTNLEQISDWLTKILVGAGLTSLTLLPDFVGGAVASLNHGPYRDMPGGGTLAVVVILAFLALGFFWSYIETRTLFTVLFDQVSAACRQAAPDLLLKVRSAPAEPGTPPIPEDATVLALSERVLKTAALLEARGAAEIRKGDLDAARDHFIKALQLDPGNPRLELRLSLVLARTGQSAKAEAIVQRVETASANNAAQQSQVQALKVGNALYKPAPVGFTEAIEIGEPLLAGDQASNGQLHLWLACAYGQRALSRHPDGQVPADDADRRLALERLADMKRLRPDLLSLARQLWRPDQYGGAPSEDDLKVFRDDPAFAALLTSA